MASGGQTTKVRVLNTLMRKNIAARLPEYNRSDGAVVTPIDCFFLQLSIPFRNKLLGSIEEQQSAEEEVAEVTDDFLKENQALGYGEWFIVQGGWPLTYFLDAKGSKKRQQYANNWFLLEEDLNENVRLKLRKKLRENTQSEKFRELFQNMTIIIMRACRYVKDVGCDEDMDTS